MVVPGGGKPGRFGYQYLVGRRAERSIASAATIAASALKKKPIAPRVIPSGADGRSLLLFAPRDPQVAPQPVVCAGAIACPACGGAQIGSQAGDLGGLPLKLA